MRRRQIATMHHIVKCAMPLHNVYFVQYDALVSFMTLYPIQYHIVKCAMPLFCIECMIMAGAEHK